MFSYSFMLKKGYSVIVRVFKLMQEKGSCIMQEKKKLM